MKSPSVKYCFLTLWLFGGSLFLNGQSSSNATVTIIGGDPNIENTNLNPPADPPVGGQLADPQNIEPTLENGFHIRYRIDGPQTQETQAVNGYASLSSNPSYSGGTKIKRKHVVTMAERSFNFKKRFKAWMPKHKKKYRPNVCGRF